jgi:hypothetical protein
MKRTIWFILIILIAVPVFAQDEEAGGGLEVGAFGDEGPIAEIQSRPKVDPLNDLRSWLARASAPPIEKDQEKPLKSLYDRQVKEMAESFKKQFGVSLNSAVAAQSSARGRRGGDASPSNRAQSAEILRLSNQLSDRVIASLRMDQQSALRKYQSEQLRIKEVKLIKQKLKGAGITLTREQESQVDDIYARKSWLRTLAIIEAKGEPYDKNLTILEKQTTQRVVQVLDQTQKAVLSAGVSKPKTSNAQFPPPQ